MSIATWLPRSAPLQLSSLSMQFPVQVAITLSSQAPNQLECRVDPAGIVGIPGISSDDRRQLGSVESLEYHAARLKCGMM